MGFKMRSKKIFFAWLQMLTGIALTAQASPFHYFDQNKSTVIQGEVLTISFEDVYGKKSEFLMLSIRGEDQHLYQVEVCPQWFFAADVAVGMKIQLRGSLLDNSDGNYYLIAQEISLHGEKIVLRDSKGFPLWSRNGTGEHGSRKGSRGRGRG
jgi:hypothetical protein